MTITDPFVEVTLKSILKLSLSGIVLLFLSNCAQKEFIKGEYGDTEKENNLNDSWSETDMQKTVQDLVNSLVQHPALARANTPPTVMVTQLQNKTSEHIDTQSIMDMVKVDLSRTGKVAFIDKEAREDISKEYDYNDSGMVSQETKKTKGGQIGADYILNGRIDSIVQEVGKEKTVYYKITLNLTNLRTSVTAWTDQKQIRKYYKKKAVGL